MNKITLIPSAIVVNNHVAYMFSQYVNLLYCYDFYKKETCLLGSIPDETFFTSDLCGKMLLYNDNLILIPLKCKKIWMYDLKTNEWRGMELKPLVSPERFKFYQAILYRNRVIMVGCFYPSIVTLDLSSGNLNYYTEAFDYFSDCASDDAYFRVDYAMKDRDIYLASCKTNVVVKINIDNYKCTFYEVGKKGNTYSGIAYDGENFWLSPRLSTSIVKWNGSELIKEIDLPQTISSCLVNYTGVITYNNRVIFNGYVAPSLQIIDDKLDSFAPKYSICQCNEETFINSTVEGDVFIGTVTGINIIFKCCIVRELLNKYINSFNIGFDMNNTFIENRTIDLEMFLNILCNGGKTNV